MINRKLNLRETVRGFLSDYLTQRVTLPGWPQYCVTRAVLHCLIHNSQFFEWLSSKEKNWLMAYAPPPARIRSPMTKPANCTKKRRL